MTDSRPSFPQTRWTLLQRVRDGSQTEIRAALETLCQAYWSPLYSVARQKQLSMHDAQDRVQGFFESILRREVFATADETKGKLRQLLLCAFDNYCGQQWRDAHCQKRGAGAVHLELSAWMDCDVAERNFLRSNNAGTSIEALYNREWATAVLDRSLKTLRADYEKRGWLARYERLVGPLLKTDDAINLEQLALADGVTTGALRVTLHRMRGHYRDKIERELATTLDTDDPQLIREEMLELFKAFN